MKLLTKSKIGKMVLKNRIVMAPMGTSSDSDGGFSLRTIRYFEERAKGGTGLIITGRMASITDYEGFSQGALTNYHHVSRLSSLAEHVHVYGAKLCVQIGPGLGRIMGKDPYNAPYSASAIPSFFFPNLTCKVLTIDDIHKITDRVGYSAKLAMDAGADSVEMHAYGSYLADQFLTPVWNKRTDQYGGSLENRTRFLGECIEAVQKYCGSDFPQIVKFTPTHMYPGYRELGEGVEIAKLLEQWGAHALHVDTGCYEVWYRQIPTVYQEPGCQVFAAEAVKKAVNIPVITQGKLNNPTLAEQVLQEGKADFIALGHQHLTDPMYAQKVKEGRYDDIVPCIGCNECLRGGGLGRNYTCAVNPECQHEVDFPLTRAKEKKSVLVIGGGPGGMSAAMTAARRGFYVELWEKTDKLGGLLIAAGAPDFKQDVRKYVQYCITQVNKLGVTVRYNKEATPQEIASAKFDKVIVAIGARASIPLIPGIENAQTAVDVLLGKVDTGDKVVVIGGGLVGCETALDLAYKGKDVTILEILPTILAVAVEAKNNAMSLRDMVNESSIKAVTGVKTRNIEVDSVTYEQDGKDITIPCNSVVIATGYSPLAEIGEQLEEMGADASVIGDCVKPGKVVDAVSGGYHAVRLL